MAAQMAENSGNSKAANSVDLSAESASQMADKKVVHLENWTAACLVDLKVAKVLMTAGKSVVHLAAKLVE